MASVEKSTSTYAQSLGQGCIRICEPRNDQGPSASIRSRSSCRLKQQEKAFASIEEIFTLLDKCQAFSKVTLTVVGLRRLSVRIRANNRKQVQGTLWTEDESKSRISSEMEATVIAINEVERKQNEVGERN